MTMYETARCFLSLGSHAAPRLNALAGTSKSGALVHIRLPLKSTLIDVHSPQNSLLCLLEKKDGRKAKKGPPLVKRPFKQSRLNLQKGEPVVA